MPNERYISKNWSFEESDFKNDSNLVIIYKEKVRKIRNEVREHFKELRETDFDEAFITREEIGKILSYETEILDLLEVIYRKITDGKMRPWLKDAEKSKGARIAVATGSYDYPTIAHFLMLLRTFTIREFNVDFLIVGLEPDSNPKEHRLLPYRYREQQLLQLIEPLKDLISYNEDGRYKGFREFAGNLMSKYTESGGWLQVLGSDSWLRFKGEFTENVRTWNDIYLKKESIGNTLNYNLLIYNRPGDESWVGVDEIEVFSRETNIPVVLDPMKEGISSSDVRRGCSVMVYPSLLGNLYVGFQLGRVRQKFRSEQSTDKNSKL